MVNESSTVSEELRRKIKITEAALEGSQHRLEQQNPGDSISEGVFWAFEELKQAAEACME